MRKFLRAVSIATIAHSGQIRKFNGLPYMTHPLAVAQILLNHGLDNEDLLAAAVCHDVVEDTTLPLASIRKALGDKTAMLVDWVTDRYKDPAHGNRAERKNLEIARLIQAPAGAQNIKAADAISNIIDMAAQDPEYAVQYIGEKEDMFSQFKLVDDHLMETVMATIKANKLMIGIRS